MHPAVQDVHAGNGHEVGSGAAQIGVEREAGRQGRQAADRQGNAEQGVGTQARFVRRAVQSDESVVNAALIRQSMPPHGGAYFAHHRHGARHPLPPNRCLSPSRLFHGLRAPRARAGGGRRPARAGPHRIQVPPRQWDCLANQESPIAVTVAIWKRHDVLLHGDHA